MPKHFSGIDERSKLSIYQAQKVVFEHALGGESLSATMSVLCQRIEALLESDGAKCSILLLSNGCLEHCAAPSLPEAYCAAIDGLAIGEEVGSCGSALYGKHQVIVVDIAEDPLWADYKDIALAHGLRACWSTPIVNSAGEALASFAVYYPRAFAPTPYHLELIDEFCGLAELVVANHQLAANQTRLTRELRDTSSRLSAILAVVPDLGCVLDEAGTVLEVFGDTSHLPGGLRAMQDHELTELFGKDGGGDLLNAIHKTLATGQTQVMDLAFEDHEGRNVFEARTSVLTPGMNASAESGRIVCMARDITARKTAEQEAARLAKYDPLTGLPNRLYMENELERLLAELDRGVYQGALVFLDLDDFKRINDLLGHQKGDELLKMVADRLYTALRRSEMVVRLGGDEFVVVLRQPMRRSERLIDGVTTAAERLVGCFNEPFLLTGSSYKITASLGIALVEYAGVGVDELLRRADAAMYAAKRTGGNRFRFYEASIQEEAQRRLKLERDLVTAIDQDCFAAWFQPQVNPDGAPVAVEALVRWRDSTGGFVSPAEFIPVAERSGLIHSVQDVVLEKSCALLAALRARYQLPEDFSVALNISPLQFGRRDLSRRLNQALQRHGLSAQAFMLEITEYVVMEDRNDIHEEMAQLREQGFRFSIDDFGTGYSSLSYLHRLPVDELKVDGRFVWELGKSAAGEPIVDSIVALSNNLSFRVVAEGVETEYQARRLREKPITALQGYYFARPMPPEDLFDYLGRFFPSLEGGSQQNSKE